jgi:hypothetical protein
LEAQQIQFDRKEARDLWRQYRRNQHYSEPIDYEVQRIYQAIAQGRTVIRAIESIKAAGLYVGGHYDSLPKLAIARADAESCYYYPNGGGGTFCATRGSWRRKNENHNVSIEIPRNTWRPIRSHYEAVAALPPIPLHLRPKRALASYHILWEAEWQRVPPADPLLLRRIGKSDAWLVVAAWNITAVERAALATRMNG